MCKRRVTAARRSMVCFKIQRVSEKRTKRVSTELSINHRVKSEQVKSAMPSVIQTYKMTL